MDRLDTLKREILEQAKSGVIRDESKRAVQQLVAVMNTAGDPISNDILCIMSNRLEQALEPQYPFNFVDPYLIQHRFMKYKEAFMRAVARHSQVWDKLYQDGARMMQSQRPEDFRDDLSLPEKFKEWYKKK